MSDANEVAALYHAHHRLHVEDLPFWQQLAARQGGPILELGCGTGRVTVPLAQAGWEIYGLDRSSAMLAWLKASLPAGLEGRLHLLQAEMASFCLARRFPLILLPCNTLSTLPPAERRAALERVAFHLAAGGLFAAGLPNPRALERAQARGEAEVEGHFAHPLSGNPVQVSSSWARFGEEFVLRWHYDHLLPDGSVRRITLEARHFLASAEAYLGELAAAGLEVVSTCGDFDGSSFTARSPALILVACKR